MTLKRTAMPILIVLLLILGSAQVALAHVTSVHVGRLGHGGVHTGHHHVYVCDDFADNLAVYAEYFTGRGGPFRLYDPNGNGSGCGNRDEDAGITVYKICVAVPLAPDLCTTQRAT
jgi:hypothetical protein